MDLTMKPRFISSADANRKCMMYSKSACEIIMIGNDTGAVNYNFDYVSEMHYICNKISLSGSKQKKKTINPKTNNDK